MPVTGLNHVNIRTTDPAVSARFYVDLLGFDYRTGPGAMGERSHWLHDAAGQPIIHLRVRAADGTGGPIDHVALSCTDKAATVARLEAGGVKFHVAEGLLPGITQVFLHDPHGVALELTFAD